MASPAGPPPASAVVQAMVRYFGTNGHTRTEALEAIAYSCEQVIERNAGNQYLDLSWMADVAAEARRRLRIIHG